MKKRMPLLKLLALCFLTIGVVSCSSDDETTIEPPGTEKPNPHTEITLKATPATVDLYNWSEIWISQKQIDGGVDIDSVVWDMPGIFRHVSVPHSSLWMQGLMFCLPGEYEMKATAYSGKDTVSVGTTIISVTNNLNDFLGLRWSSTESIKKGDRHYTSNVDNYSLTLEYIADHPYALLHFSVSPDMNKNYIEANAGSRKLLFDYITRLYGKAGKVYDGEDITQTTLTDDYNVLFSKDLNTIYTGIPFYPLAVWQTDKTNIALIAHEEGFRSCTVFKIIAEPRTK
jgi:hypothetical protein